MNQKILIYGSYGWIGKQFCSYLSSKGIIFHEGTARLENELDIEKEILKINPDNIIGFTGRTHGKIGTIDYTTIDYLEQEGKLYDNIRDNLYGPLNLSIISQKLNKHYTYIGTGCIFEYDDKHNFGIEENGFTEMDSANFFGSSYSIVKGFTDKIMKHFENNVLNLRIRMPINSENNPRNFITKITNYKKICSIPNSMTVLPDFFPIMLDMIQNKTSGTFNLTNPGLISHNEILEMYKEIVNPSFKWENFTVEEQNKILDSKRSNNYLDTTKLESLYPNINNIKISVRKILEQYK